MHTRGTVATSSGSQGLGGWVVCANTVLGSLLSTLCDCKRLEVWRRRGVGTVRACSDIYFMLKFPHILKVSECASKAKNVFNTDVSLQEKAMSVYVGLLWRFWCCPAACLNKIWMYLISIYTQQIEYVIAWWPQSAVGWKRSILGRR